MRKIIINGKTHRINMIRISKFEIHCSIRTWKGQKVGYFRYSPGTAATENGAFEELKHRIETGRWAVESSFPSSGENIRFDEGSFANMIARVEKTMKLEGCPVIEKTAMVCFVST